MIKYSKDKVVRFNEEAHTYFQGDKKLMGVTTYISSFKNKFDSDYIAERYAKKNGLIKEDVLVEWKTKADISIRNGTACHSIIENYINTGKVELLGVSDKEKVAVKFIKEKFLTGNLTPVEAEMIVYKNELASQIDCIAKNKEGDYFILDWKTNKSIETNSWGKQMLSKFSYLPDCSYYHYSLQLALYKDMCKEYRIKDCYIVHLENEDYNVIRPFKINL